MQVSAVARGGCAVPAPVGARRPAGGLRNVCPKKAYGRYCQNQSKAHVAGQKGTPFSQCVTAMAKLASGSPASPKTACAAMSKQHVAGPEGHAVQQLRGRGREAAQEPAQEPVAWRYGSNPNENLAAARFSV